MTEGLALTADWGAILGAAPEPWKAELLHRLAAARRYSLALDELPWAPPGGVGVVHVPLRPSGVPGLGAGEALARAVAGLGAPAVAAPYLLRGPGMADPALAAFRADAEEDLLEHAAALGVSCAGCRASMGGGDGPGLTLDVFALGASGPSHGLGFDLQPGDGLVPAPAGALPEAMGWVPTGGRPWWDVAVSLVRGAGLGLRLSLAGDAEGLAWVRGALPPGGARLLPEPVLELEGAEGVVAVPLSLLDVPPCAEAPTAAPPPPPAAVGGLPWLRAQAQAAGTPQPGWGLLAPWPGEAEVVRLPEDEQALAWALADRTVVPGEDAFWAMAQALAGVALRLACVGAEPLGVALAFHPGRGPGGAERLEAAALGLRQAALALELPVLHAGLQPEAGDDLGLALLGVGVVPDPAPPLDVTAPDATALIQVGHRTAPLAFRAPGDGLFLLGEPTGDLDACYRLAACVREGVRLGLLRSAQVLGPEGLLGAALLGARAGGLGGHLLVAAEDPALGACLPGCVLASLSAAGEGGLEALASAHGVPMRKVGVTGGSRVALALGGRPVLDVGLDEG